MSRTFWVLVRSSYVLVLVSFACVQLFSQTQSLGDVAREQKDTQKQLTKNGKTPKTLTNDDLNPGSAALTSGTTGSPSTSVEGQNPQPKENKSAATKCQPVEAKNVEEGNKDNSGGHSPVGSVLDRPKDSKPDIIIVPAGTEIKVDIDESKTVVPVRVGFATPIPALSQVTVHVTRPLSIPYPDNGAFYPNVDYTEYATVTAITVDGKTYQVQTNSVRLFSGGTHSEVAFKLDEPLKVLR